VIEYDTIVVGSSFEAVLCAFINDYPIFFAEERRPFRFDYLATDVNLEALKIPSGPPKSLTTFGEPKVVGYPKELLWEKLLFLMAVVGHSPLSNLCAAIRYNGDTVVCSNEYSKIMEFTFNECLYFGDNNATGLIEKKKLDGDRYICYDYIAFNKGGKHEIDYLYTGDDFVREVWFYPSDRIDGNTPVKDACAVSILNEEQPLDFNYSQTMARFKTVHEMESRGMKGTFAHDYTTAGNPKHYKFRTTSLYRETSEQPNELLPQATNIKIPQIREQDLLQDLPAACVAYDRFLRYW
jgi:hypothetical protein